MSKSSDVVAARLPGIFQRTLVRMLMRECVVVSNELPVDGFRLIALQGATLKGIRWRPGQKIQVNQGRLFGDRAYTPLSWDEDQGITRLLVRAIGQGPGAEWAMNVQPGDACQFGGPSTAVELDRPGRTLLFGDETSVASIIAAAGQPTADVQTFIEADDQYTCQGMTMRLALTRIAYNDALMRRRGVPADMGSFGRCASRAINVKWLLHRGSPADRLTESRQIVATHYC